MGSEALPPPPGLCAWAGYPTVPRQRGLWGTECCPFFCSICRPQSGRAGNETMAFFLQDLDKVGIPTLLPIATKRSISSKKQLAGARTSKIPARPNSGPKRAQKLATRGPGPNRTKPGIPGLLTGRSKARCWWPGSSPYRDA